MIEQSSHTTKQPFQILSIPNQSIKALKHLWGGFFTWIPCLSKTETEAVSHKATSSVPTRNQQQTVHFQASNCHEKQIKITSSMRRLRCQEPKDGPARRWNKTRHGPAHLCWAVQWCLYKGGRALRFTTRQASGNKTKQVPWFFFFPAN